MLLFKWLCLLLSVSWHLLFIIEQWAAISPGDCICVGCHVCEDEGWVEERKTRWSQREIHQKQQHLTNKARTSPSAAAAVKCFCAFVSPFRHCTVMLHPCLLPFFAAAAVVPLPPSLPPLFSPTPSKSPFLFESSSTSGGGRSPRNCFCSLRQNRFQTGWGTTQGSCDDSS